MTQETDVFSRTEKSFRTAARRHHMYITLPVADYEYRCIRRRHDNSVARRRPNEIRVALERLNRCCDNRRPPEPRGAVRPTCHQCLLVSAKAQHAVDSGVSARAEHRPKQTSIARVVHLETVVRSA